MYYYVKNDCDRMALMVLNEKDVIDEFSEKTTTPKGIGNKHFYDPETRYIYCYYAGGQCLPTTKCTYTEEEANALLLKLALDEAEKDQSGTILFKPYQNVNDLIDDIQQYIECLEEDESDTLFIQTLKEIVEKLSIEEHIALYERNPTTGDFTGRVYAINEPLKQAFIKYGLIDSPLAESRYFLGKNITFADIEKHTKS